MLYNSYNRLILLICIFLFAGCKKDDLKNEDNKTLNISSITSSLVNPDHTSEGFLVTLKNGDIIHFFRQDPLITGDHIGNSGGIYKRVSSNNGKSWSIPVIVYNDEFDDRNIRGGITEEGYIIIFFRRYQAKNWSAVDLNYIISKDDGKSFNLKTKLDFKIDPKINEIWIDNFLQIGKNKYLLPVHGVGYCEMKTFSFIDQNLKFGNNWIWDKTITMPLGIDEPYCCLNGDKLICLFRDESVSHSNYYQSTSSDLGKSWSNPVKTNIGDSFFCPSPLILSDNELTNDIIVIATDRRSYEPFNSQIWIYNNSFESVFDKPMNYKELIKLSRPNPNNYQLYGYPIATKMKNGNWLVIITESSYDGINEDADFYQFELVLTSVH